MNYSGAVSVSVSPSPLVSRSYTFRTERSESLGGPMRHELSIFLVEFLRIIAVVSISIIFGSMQGSIYFFIIFVARS